MILSDRLITVLLVVFILLCGLYCTYVTLSIHPIDLQVAVHYTAYGETTFYRNKWYYFSTFIVFGGVLAILHTLITAKLYMQGRRHLALLFLGLSVSVLIVAWFVTRSILRIAFL